MRRIHHSGGGNVPARGSPDARYSAFAVVKNALTGHKGWREQWPEARPKKEYDIIIVGTGGHGLGAAYHLAKEHGITDVAVIGKGWLGAATTGATPRSVVRITSRRLI